MNDFQVDTEDSSVIGGSFVSTGLHYLDNISVDDAKEYVIKCFTAAAEREISIGKVRDFDRASL